jgi:hypothetical protein
MATKHDSNKPRTDLLPAKALLQVAECLAYGATKYGDQLPDAVGPERLLAATLRHLLAYMAGERLDVESELPHLAHAATDLLYALQCGASLAERALDPKPGFYETPEAKAAIADFGARTAAVKADSVAADVEAERARQVELWGVQEHRSGLHASGWTAARERECKAAFAVAAETNEMTWKIILDEEIAEAYNAMNAEDAYTELVQVAAVAMSMAASIKKNGLFGKVSE